MRRRRAGQVWPGIPGALLRLFCGVGLLLPSGCLGSQTLGVQCLEGSQIQQIKSQEAWP